VQRIFSFGLGSGFHSVCILSRRLDLGETAGNGCLVVRGGRPPEQASATGCATRKLGRRLVAETVQVSIISNGNNVNAFKYEDSEIRH
jgi:hypothetical protein